MDDLLQTLKAVGEGTRLRLVQILAQGAFNVSELTRILGQSQPRVSRHLKLLADARVLDRIKEGSWVLFRLDRSAASGQLAADIVRLIPLDDPEVMRDQQRLNEVLAQRKARAEAYFAVNAGNWHRIRALHVAEGEVEAEINRLVGTQECDLLVDIGTGTGRMLELLMPQIGADAQGVGIDLSREMLAVARANLEAAGLSDVQVRHGDLFALPFNEPVADLVVLHQVLHYLDQPERAVMEAGRIIKPGGRMLIVDFAPHEYEFLRDEHAHRYLGFSMSRMESWLKTAGLRPLTHNSLSPPKRPTTEAGLTVSLWLAQRPG